MTGNTADNTAIKQSAVIFKKDILQGIRMRNGPDSEAYKRAVREAERFAVMTDEELWHLMYGPALKRSYHVFSNGYCPACKASVPLHNWELDVVRYPWKVCCPSCGELFPKNDFYAYYLSGLGADGVFSYDIADSRLLYNQDGDHSFGVDDGNGYEEDGKRWYFIAYYLLFGHWAMNVLEGIKCLARAHVITGEPTYARKAMIMLDRLSDLFPDFDFMKQGVIYEKENYDAGYISYWFRSCTDIRDLTMAYDMIFDAGKQDPNLVDFLAHQSAQFEGIACKQSFEHIQRNIETRIFRDALNHRKKIESNFPMTDATIVLIQTVLAWPDNRAMVEQMTRDLVRKATSVDGTTGEKGVVVYSAYALLELAYFLYNYELIEPDFLAALVGKHPSIIEGYRFFIDMWCLEKYYPRIGNTGAFAKPDDVYAVFYYRDEFYASCLDPDIEVFMWKLYEMTGKSDFAKAIYISNGHRTYGCFSKSLLTPDPEQLRERLERLVREEGSELQQTSVNKERWRLAVLHAGAGSNKRSAWMKYDAGGDHGHADGMAIGLFAKGLDLLPDFGYAPVQYGLFGDGPERHWYYATAAHNTVVVDGNNHREHQGLVSDVGVASLFAAGRLFQVIQACAPEFVGGKVFERTLISIDISPEDSYYIDIFRVEGGSEHVKYSHGTLGELTLVGREALPAEGFGQAGMMRDFAVVLPTSSASAPWYALWKADDHFQVNAPHLDVSLKYIDLTEDAEVYTARSWVDLWSNRADRTATGQSAAWIPTVMIRRTGESGLQSNFVDLYEPFVGQSSLLSARQHRLPQGGIAITVKLATGLEDTLLFFSRQTTHEAHGDGPSTYASNGPSTFDLDGRSVTTDAEIVFLRSRDGSVIEAAAINASVLITDGIDVALVERKSYVEFP